MLRLVASSMGVRRWLVHTLPLLGFALTGLVGLLTSDAPPTGTTRLSDWLKDNADGLGRHYVSELGRNYRR